MLLLACWSSLALYLTRNRVREIVPYAQATLFGLAIIGAIILGASPTSWVITENPRIIYPAGVGFAMLVTGGVAVDGVGESRARAIRDAISRLADASIIDRYP